jgi:hypothetical protein
LRKYGGDRPESRCALSGHYVFQGRFIREGHMYYEEKVINGILYYKNDPDNEWTKMSLEYLTGRYLVLVKELEKLRSEGL